MSRISCLLCGVVLGAAGMFVSMKYYVVHAPDGLHLIPKATAELGVPYVDIRGFTLSDWDARRDLALAIVQARQSHLLEDAAFGGLQQTMEQILNSLHR